jgi:hypothetical protein
MRGAWAFFAAALATGWAGAARATEPTEAFFGDQPIAEHADDVVDYTLRAKLDPVSHSVHGEGTIRWRNASSMPVRELWLHLYLNAFKNERSTYLREPVGGFRGTGPMKDWAAIDVKKLLLHGADAARPVDLWPGAELHRPGDEDETDVRIPLPQEVAPGQSITLDVEWDDKLPSILERTGFFSSFHFVGQWFPKIARLEPSGKWAHFPFHHLAEFYADFGTYDVTLDVPSSFTIGATGPAVESAIAGGRRTERHVQADVHDFAWTAWDHFESRKETIDGIDVTVLFPSGYGQDAGRELATMRFGIPHFRALYGPYPYRVLTLVHPPEGAEEAGGMEYPTLITTGGPWYGPPFARLLELVTMHEFGHQYFYGLVATDEVSWPFLDEGLNSYAESEALGAWLGAGSVASLGGFTLSDAAVQSVFGNPSEHDEPVAQPAFQFRTGGDYGHLVYERTASILETFRLVYGEPAVSRALGRYTRHFRFEHPGPDDLIASFEVELGAPAAASLRTALFDEGWVDYTVVNVFSKRSELPGGIFDKEGKREIVTAKPEPDGAYEGWVLVTRRGTLTFPVDVELELADGTIRRVRWDGDRALRIPYTGKVALCSAVVDPDHTVLLDDDPTNNHAAAASEAHAPRVIERVAYWAELWLSAIAL